MESLSCLMWLESVIKINKEDKIKDDNIQNEFDLSVERTILSNTRTFSAWLRSGLSAVLGGLSIIKFMRTTDDDDTFVFIIGIIFIIVGTIMYFLGYLNYKIVYLKIKDQYRQTISLKMIMFIISSLSVASFLLLLLLYYE